MSGISRIVYATLLAFSAAACGGGSSVNDNGSCRHPRGTVRLSISPTACAALSGACDTIEVVARSPQISSLIAQGKSPCASTSSDPTGCSLGARLWTAGFCSAPSSCGAHDFDLATVFAPAAADASINITDTVTYCPVDAQGDAVGNCAGTIVNQCDATAVTTVLVNAYTPPPSTSTAEVTVSSLTCRTVSTDPDGWKYCDVDASGTAKGPVGSYFYAVSNPIFADSFIMTCGAWTLDTTNWGCHRAAGQPESFSWTTTFDDLWINPSTYPSGRTVNVTGQVQYDEDDPTNPYGSILADDSGSVLCGG